LYRKKGKEVRQMKKLLLCFVVTAVLILPAMAAGAGEYETAPDSSPTAEFVEEPIINVQIPIDLDFTIDPFELAGRGSVYSEQVEFVNYGDTDVTLTITDVSVLFANRTDFEAVAVPFGEEFVSDKKAICLMLDFDSPYLNPVSITGEQYAPITLELGASESGKENSHALILTGTVNPYPAKEWRDGDVKIHLSYQIEALPPVAPEAVMPEELTGEENEDGETSASPSIDSEQEPDADEPPNDENDLPPNMGEDAETPIADSAPPSEAEMAPADNSADEEASAGDYEQTPAENGMLPEPEPPEFSPDTEIPPPDTANETQETE
jgi:hypothetical protein